MIKNIVAIVDDSPVESNIFSSYVTRMGNEAVRITKGQDIVDCFLKDKKIAGHSYRDIDVILLNLFMKDISGIEVLQQIKDKRGGTQVIIITGSTDKSLAIKTISLGAYDFIIKGDKEIFNKLSNSILSAIKKKNLRYRGSEINLRTKDSVTISDIVTESKIMENVIALLRRAANSMIPVFISGEDGSGRELIAKIMHDSSTRLRYPFAIFNCKNMMPESANKILFGYDVKDRNGNVKRVHGKIRIANKGTLYIENIEYLPRDVQSKLLNFIQYGEVEIYNSIDLYTSDTRIAASSSKSLVQLLGDKSNNFDLLKRLSAILIELPNLQQRGVADIKLLANSFCNTFNINENKEVSGITEEAMEVLVNHRWKKNIKELRNVILKAVILCDGNYLDVEHFPDLVRANDNKARAPSLKDSNRFIDLFTSEGYHKTLLQIQKEIIQRFLKEFKYKSEDVAKYLNIKHKK